MPDTGLAAALVDVLTYHNDDSDQCALKDNLTERRTPMTWLFDRLKEPSTHSALAAIAAASVPLFGQYGVIAAAIFAVLGFSVSEKQS